MHHQSAHPAECMSAYYHFWWVTAAAGSETRILRDAPAHVLMVFTHRRVSRANQSHLYFLPCCLVFPPSSLSQDISLSPPSDLSPPQSLRDSRHPLFLYPIYCFVFKTHFDLLARGNIHLARRASQRSLSLLANLHPASPLRASSTSNST